MSTIAVTAPGTGPAVGRLVARSLLAAALTLALVLALTRAASSPPAGEAVVPEAAAPLAFVPNAGQSDPRVRFMAQGGGYAFFFTESGLTMLLQRDGAERSLALELGFRGANPDVRPVASGEAAGTVNYFTGPRDEWRAGLQANSELTYPELWPGIDMVFRGEGGRLKYEFHLAPGADPSRIRLAYQGAQGLALGAGGALQVNTALGSLSDSRPVSYQRQGGRRVPVESSYQLHGAAGYGFALGGYDASRPLVIDPGLAYSTYLGGGTISSHDESAFAVAVDSAGSAYLTGETSNPTFPTTLGAFDTSLGGAPDAFVTKLSPDGSSLVYSTYLGGASIDRSQAIALDAQGSAYVAGSTSSPDFPVTAGSFDPVFGQSTDAFVTKLDPTGSSLVYSSYLGGGVQDSAQAIALDAADNAYVTGFTSSNAFPTTPGAVDSTFGAGNTDVFVTKFNPTGSGLVYSTYLSGNGIGEQGTGIAVDGAGSAYVTGFAGAVSLSTQVNYPTTPGAFDTTQNGGSDVFVTKLNTTGSALDYSTFLGGATTDQGEGIALGGDGSAYVTGRTASTAYPTTAGAFDESYNGGTHDAFVTKVDPTGSALGYSTYLGSTANEFGLAIDVDGEGRAHLTGTTASPGYPTTAGAFDPTINLGFDAFATRLDTAGATLSYSTFLGGNAIDEGHGIAVDATGDIYVAGLTESSNYPTTAGAFQTSGGGGQNREAFATKLDEGAAAGPACSDGADNDADGQTDFPADPGCESATDDSESPDPPPPPQCSDGEDNDSDGQTDFPADPGCESASDDSESPDPPAGPQCSDGQDNDGDGQTDFPADPGCTSASDNNEVNAQCSDGLDNDGDGQTDHPADPGCNSPADNNETNPKCNDGLDNDGDGQIDFPADPGCNSASDNNEANAKCNDGLDNDGDGQIDFPADPGCSSATDNNEANAQCNDGQDNDGDGAVDFPADPGCISPSDNNESNAQCNDGQDNDGDGQIDFPADPGCSSSSDNNETNKRCNDGLDNDGDGLVDFPADAGCSSLSDNNETDPPPDLQQKLLAEDGSAADLFGSSVAVEGDTAVVGAPDDDGGEGAVYVFERSGDNWVQTGKLTASDGGANDQLGTSVAIEGDTIVAGARFDDVGANSIQGSAYTFARTGPAARTETAKLTASDGDSLDGLGISVGIDGDTIVAGASGDEVGGSVYTFARTGPAARTETAKLTASDGGSFDLLGVSVGIDGDTIVAGAPRASVGGSSDQEGSVYTFARTGPAARTETAKLTASDGAADDFLGESVAIDGDTIVAGAPFANAGANSDQGSAYTFARTGPAARNEMAKLTAPDGAADDQLGQSVAIDGDTIVAGAPGDTVGANPDQGSASVFIIQ